MSINFEKWKWIREEVNSFTAMINSLSNKGTYQPSQSDLDWFKEIRQSIQSLITLIPENKKLIEVYDFPSPDSSIGSRAGSYLSRLRMVIDEYFLDCTREIRRRTDDALAHLQSMIAIDSQYQNNWQWGANEDHYEKFGAAHFLLHRIWSFKANSAKSRTDLILFDNQKLQEKTFILTEWKKYTPGEKKLENLIESTIIQMKEYVTLHLHNFPFEPVCYLIIVSEKNQKTRIDSINGMPAERYIGGIKIKVVNIICDPKTPSKTR